MLRGVHMFFDRSAEIVPYARFLEARRRRCGHLTVSRTPEAVDPEMNVLLAPPGEMVEEAAVIAALPDVVSDPGR